MMKQVNAQQRRIILYSAILITAIPGMALAQFRWTQEPSADFTATPTNIIPTIILTVTPTGALPDLVIDSSATFTWDSNGDCIWDYYQLDTICIHNQGTGNATASFTVIAGPKEWTVDGLAVGESICLTDGTLISGPAIVIDPDDRIVEWNEDNNVVPLMTPPPPIVCTSTPAFAITKQP